MLSVGLSYKVQLSVQINKIDTYVYNLKFSLNTYKSIYSTYTQKHFIIIFTCLLVYLVDIW